MQQQPHTHSTFASASTLFASLSFLLLLRRDAYITNAVTLSSSVMRRESECMDPEPELELEGAESLLPFLLRGSVWGGEGRGVYVEWVRGV
jgi:hypothetical protein